jgi:hypothetical protein
MLKVFVGIFMSFPKKLATLYHVDQCMLELKSSISCSDCQTSRMLFRVGAEYSRRDLFAITSNVGVKLRAVESPKAEVVGRELGDLSFDHAFLKIFSGSETKFSGRLLFIHYPEIR